jgi:hypothetical protein
MDLQIEKEKLKEYAKKVKGVLWLLGATVAPFLICIGVLALVIRTAGNPDQLPSPEELRWDNIIYAILFVSLIFPAIFLRLIKIRLGKTATTVFTALCTISLIIDFLFAGLACLLRLIAGLVPHAGLFADFVFETAGLLVLGIFARISLLISLLAISENPKRTMRIILLVLSLGEIALLAFLIFNGLNL